MGCGQSVPVRLTAPEELLVERCRDLLEFSADEPLGTELDLGGIGLVEVIHNEPVVRALLSVKDRVRTLDLGRNPYAAATGLPEVLCLLDQVTELRVGKTTLTALPAAVERWKLLERVELSGNQLGPTLPEQVWGWAAARHLDISSNRLATFPGEVNGWGALERLDASYNRLVSLPPGVGAWTKCTRLDLNNNEMELLPEEFGQLAALKTLNFQHNELKVLPKSFGQLKALESLDLSHNQFVEFPDALEGLSALRTLNFSHCKLQSVSVALGGLRALEEADFTSNMIREFDKHAFRSLKGSPLRQLTVRENLLSLLPESMGVLSNLERLDVCFNQLHALGNFLAACPKLVAISASHNEISIVPPDFVKMSQLKVLDLRTNPLGLFPKWVRERVGMPLDLTVKPDPEADYQGELKLIWNRDVAAIEQNRTMRRKMMNVGLELPSKGQLRHVDQEGEKRRRAESLNAAAAAGQKKSPYNQGIVKSSSSKRKKKKAADGATAAADAPSLGEATKSKSKRKKVSSKRSEKNLDKDSADTSSGATLAVKPKRSAPTLVPAVPGKADEKPSKDNADAEKPDEKKPDEKKPDEKKPDDKP